PAQKAGFCFWKTGLLIELRSIIRRKRLTPPGSARQARCSTPAALVRVRAPLFREPAQKAGFCFWVSPLSETIRIYLIFIFQPYKPVNLPLLNLSICYIAIIRTDAAQEKEMATDPYEEIKKEIRVYAHDMNHWWKNLQSDSVAEWVLLTSFACWGIPNRFFQLCAFMLTLIFFASKLSKLHHKHSFIDSEKHISKKIRQAPVSDIQRSALYLRLTKIKKFRRNKNVVFILKRNWRFLAGYLYLTISFVYLLKPEFFTLG
ncbi:hypothetical protein, partial [Citrobacter amalonaticus]